MPPPTTKQKKSLADLSEIEDNEHVTPKVIVLTGQPGSGKTSAAASLFSPEVGKRLTMSMEELKERETLTLDGAVWVKTDSQALVSLKMIRVKPQFTLDYAVLRTENGGNASATIRDLHTYLGQAKEAGAHTMILDTATSFGQAMEDAFVAGSDNTMAGWGRVGDEYTRLFNLCLSLGLRQVWLAQPDVSKAMKASLAESSKKNADDDKIKLEQARAMATSVGENSYIVPALSGNKVMPLIGAQPSLSGWIRRVEMNGKTTREFYPFGTADAPGKNRYEKILQKKEPADLWLLDQKIKDALS